MKKLIFLALLTACGTNEMTDEQKEASLSRDEKSEDAPSLKGWQIMNGALDSCLHVSKGDMNCSTEFQAGEKNCSDATFKFIVKTEGYMYVLTLEHVFIRQGEPHKLEFRGEPEIYNIESLADERYHALQCYGSNGEVIRL
jgi:hypothetical protein